MINPKQFQGIFSRFQSPGLVVVGCHACRLPQKTWGDSRPKISTYTHIYNILPETNIGVKLGNLWGFRFWDLQDLLGDLWDETNSSHLKNGWLEVGRWFSFWGRAYCREGNNSPNNGKTCSKTCENVCWIMVVKALWKNPRLKATFQTYMAPPRREINLLYLGSLFHVGYGCVLYSCFSQNWLGILANTTC